MQPWASWTAKTAVLTLTAGLAATAGGLSGVALASSGDSAALAASRGGAVSGQAAAPAGIPGDICTDAGALLGIAGAACRNVALTSPPGTAATGTAATGASTAGDANAAAGQGAGQGTGSGTGQGTSQGVGATVGQVVRQAVAPVTAVLGATAGTAPGLKTVPVLAPLTAVTGNPSTSRIAGAGGVSEPGTDGTSPPAPATRAGDTNVPAATQLAGLGALPGLADLPSSAGLASTPAQNGAMGGGNPIPGTALSAANSGMSSDSFAALAVGALLAGASALKIAGRRARDRKAGIGVAL
jgi:hypothetical protein